MATKYANVVDVEVPTYGKVINLITKTGPNIQIHVDPNARTSTGSGLALTTRLRYEITVSGKKERVLFDRLALAKRFDRLFNALKSVSCDTRPAVYEVRSFEEKVAPSSYILGSSADGKQFTSMQGELRQAMTEEAILVGTKLLVFADAQSAGQFLLMHKRLPQGKAAAGFGGFVSTKCPWPFGEAPRDLSAEEFVAPKTVFTAKLERVEDYFWQCADGRILRLGEMTDLHLLNCLEGRHGSEEMRERMVRVLKNRSAGMRSAADGLDSRIDLALQKVKRKFEGFTSIPKDHLVFEDPADDPVVGDDW